MEPVVNHLKRYNVKLGFEIPKLINFFSSFAGEGSYESLITLLSAGQAT